MLKNISINFWKFLKKGIVFTQSSLKSQMQMMCALLFQRFRRVMLQFFF